MSSTPLTNTETYLFYGAIISSVLAVFSLIGYFFAGSNTTLSRGSMFLLVVLLLGALGMAGVYSYLRSQDGQGYIHIKSTPPFSCDVGAKCGPGQIYIQDCDDQGNKVCVCTNASAGPPLFNC